MPRLVILFLLAFWPALATAQSNSRLGPKDVWNLPMSRFGACLQHKHDPAACLSRLMRDTHASPQALAVSRALDSEGFMSAFQSMGKVDLATMTFPARANTNQVPYLVNGTPPLVSTELDPNILNITTDPHYPALKAAYPDLEFWPSDAEFRALDHPATGGQTFLFAYPLRDGCHACALAGYALVAHGFNSDGRYQGPRLVGLEPAKR